jgi:hypothetical protein
MKLTIPTKKEFQFTSEEIEGYPILRRLKDDEVFDADTCFTVSFRQATRGEDDLRQGYLQEKKFRMGPDGDIEQIDTANVPGLRRLEIRLTLSACTLEYPDDKGAFKALKFVTQGSIEKIGASEIGAFDRWYSLLPVQWADVIHEGCLEVNARWDPKSLL